MINRPLAKELAGRENLRRLLIRPAYYGGGARRGQGR